MVSKFFSIDFFRFDIAEQNSVIFLASLKVHWEKFAERARFLRAVKGSGGPLSQIEGTSSSVNEEVPGSAFRLKAPASFRSNGG